LFDVTFVYPFVKRFGKKEKKAEMLDYNLSFFGCLDITKMCISNELADLFSDKKRPEP